MVCRIELSVRVWSTQGTNAKRAAAKPAAQARGRPAKRRAGPDSAAAEADAHQVGPGGGAEGFVCVC